VILGKRGYSPLSTEGKGKRGTISFRNERAVLNVETERGPCALDEGQKASGEGKKKDVGCCRAKEKGRQIFPFLKKVARGAWNSRGGQF